MYLPSATRYLDRSSANQSASTSIPELPSVLKHIDRYCRYPDYRDDIRVYEPTSSPSIASTLPIRLISQSPQKTTRPSYLPSPIYPNYVIDNTAKRWGINHILFRPHPIQRAAHEKSHITASASTLCHGFFAPASTCHPMSPLLFSLVYNQPSSSVYFAANSIASAVQLNGPFA